MNKPLGQKAYGSIGHLPASRIGPGDHRVPDGQSRICTMMVRDKHDRVIVQQKVDGSCVCVANIDGTLVPLGRAGWSAKSSPYEQHQHFADWVFENTTLFDFLKPGERLAGEWLAQAHGTRYDLPHLPLVAFDILRNGHERVTVEQLHQRVEDRLPLPQQVGHGPTSVETAMAAADPSWHGALDPIEGCVWRVERNGKVDFLAKYVRQDKVDGSYLPEISGVAAVWNWRPNRETQVAACDADCGSD